ncbi:uncharacterized protein BX664DRAFT_341232 [Halteromyces radiatus]|uniref:uncharacterized protein n=1 Tax=Halteromyces radiatus TaxID=101107 RepID=UPI0022206A2D|nr:uncharacterized protein BX664DRAFT_341232 [Halteromyces radiatus]KAI8081762.1 hypothetical protein BX664DRAFT_341232 [Halteromyces radiatus]
MNARNLSDAESSVGPQRYKRPHTESSKQAAKHQKLAGKALLDERQANKNVPKCKKCTNAGVTETDDYIPHGNSRSRHCQFHQATMNDVIKTIFGDSWTMATRKITPDKFLALEGENKQKVSGTIISVVDYVREVAIKANMFISYYFLRQLEHDYEQTGSTSGVLADDAPVASLSSVPGLSSATDDAPSADILSVTGDVSLSADILSVTGDVSLSGDVSLADGTSLDPDDSSMASAVNTPSPAGSLESFIRTAGGLDMSSIVSEGSSEGLDQTDVAGIIDDDDVRTPGGINRSFRGMHPVLFHGNFYYGCIQIVLGQHITNKTGSIPDEECIVSLNKTDISYSNTLAHLARNPAVMIKNCVVETLEQRAAGYLGHLLRVKTKLLSPLQAKRASLYLYDVLSGATNPYWPTEIERTDELNTVLEQIKAATPLGPTAITPKVLVTNVEVYMTVLYKILVQLEQYNAGEMQRVDEVQTQATLPWALSMVKMLDDYRSLNRRQRTKPKYQLFEKVNNDTEDNYTFSSPVCQASKDKLVKLVLETRQQIKNSINFLQGHTEIARTD